MGRLSGTIQSPGLIPPPLGLSRPALLTQSCSTSGLEGTISLGLALCYPLLHCIFEQYVGTRRNCCSLATN